MDRKFRVIIVEDVKLELKGTEEIFRNEIPEAEVMGTAMTEKDFWSLMEQGLPDMVLLDLGLGGSTTVGIDICKNIRKRYPKVKVLIFTGEILNEKLWVDALDAGAHVLVEKPFAVSHEEAAQMLEHAKRNNRRIMNAFPMRFNPAVIEAKKTVDSGHIGDILCITGINHGKIPSGWFIDKKLSGGGGVMDHTVHLADLIRWFTGSEYRDVYCESGCLLHNKGIDDTGIVMAHMENGVFATIDCSWAHHRNYPIWPQVDMEIIGTKGTLELRAFGQVNHITDQKGEKIEDIVWNEDGDAGLIREFIDVVRTGKEPVASGLDGARALEVAEAAYKSTSSHRKERVVHI